MSLAPSPGVEPSLDSLALPQAIRHYVSTFNRGSHQETAALFLPQGQLLPPIDPPVVGPLAIQRYLQQEAQGMRIQIDRLLPLPPSSSTPSQQIPPISRTQAKVGGRVHTALFSVNVAWTFDLDLGPTGTGPERIAQVKVDLLASWEELLSLRAGQT